MLIQLFVHARENRGKGGQEILRFPGRGIRAGCGGGRAESPDQQGGILYFTAVGEAPAKGGQGIYGSGKILRQGGPSHPEA